LHPIGCFVSVGAGRAESTKRFERFGRILRLRAILRAGPDYKMVSVPKSETRRRRNGRQGARRRRNGSSARQECPEGQGRRWTKKTMPSLLRLQEPLGVRRTSDPQRDAKDAAGTNSQQLDDVSISTNTGMGSGGTELPLGAVRRAWAKACRAISTVARANRRCRSAGGGGQKVGEQTRSRCARSVITYSAPAATRWAARSCEPSASEGEFKSG